MLEHIPNDIVLLEEEMVLRGKMDICDLAGSERLGKNNGRRYQQKRSQVYQLIFTTIRKCNICSIRRQKEDTYLFVIRH